MKKSYAVTTRAAGRLLNFLRWPGKASPAGPRGGRVIPTYEVWTVDQIWALKVHGIANAVITTSPQEAVEAALAVQNPQIFRDNTIIDMDDLAEDLRLYLEWRKNNP